MDISQASQIVSGVADIAKDMLGDSVASCEVKIGGGWGSRVALWLHAHSKCGNVRCESGLIEPADVIELFVDWMGGEEKMAPGRFKQLERRVSDLFTDIGPTPAQVEPTKTETQKHVESLKGLLAEGLIEPADFANSLRLIRAERDADRVEHEEVEGCDECKDPTCGGRYVYDPVRRPICEPCLDKMLAQDSAQDAARTLSIIEEKCKTGLRVARAQEGRSDDICHLNRMIGTTRVCERILGIIEGGGQ